MTTFSDPQTWIFPPLGAARLPADPSASFGPISKGDSIQLVWAPPSQKPAISMICANADGTTFTIAQSGATSSPFTYTFNQTINNGSSHVCWMFFPRTSLGNTLTFTYNNNPSSSTARTWAQSPQIAAALSGNAVTVTETETETSTITQITGGLGGGTAIAGSGTIATLTFTTTLLATASDYTTTITSGTGTITSTGFAVLPATSPADLTSQASSNSLSPGASAGIAVGATIVFVLLLLIGFLVFRRLKKDRQEDAAALAAGPTTAVGGPVVGGSGRGPVQVPPDQKYTPPMSHIGQPPPQGYYQPQQTANPGRAVHEVQG